MMLSARFSAFKAGFEVADVALHAGSEIGVERDGGGALVFAELGKDLVRERNGQAEAEQAPLRRRVHGPDWRKQRAAIRRWIPHCEARIWRRSSGK